MKIENAIINENTRQSYYPHVQFLVLKAKGKSVTLDPFVFIMKINVLTWLSERGSSAFHGGESGMECVDGNICYVNVTCKLWLFLLRPKCFLPSFIPLLGNHMGNYGRFNNSLPPKEK
jgi:hypothetical protein